MADNKQTKAQQAASPRSRKKVTVEEQPSKALAKAKSNLPAKTEEKKTDPKAQLPGDAAFPLRYAFAVFCGILLLIFVSVFFSDEGLILQWIVSFFTGLFGRNVYYISIPVLIYLIWIQLSSRNQLVRGRSFSMVGFMLAYGCLSHLVSNPVLTEKGFAQFSELYKTGMLGTSGGVVCGFITEVLTTGFGSFFTFVTMIILIAIFLMFGAQLDIPGMLLSYFRKAVSMYQAIRTRMAERAQAEYEEYEDEEEEAAPGPWSLLWDKIARRRIERLESVDADSDDEADYPADEEDPETDPEHSAPFVDVYDEDDDPFRELFEEDVPPRISADILPDDPELDAGVAAQPGTPPQNKVTAQEAAQQAAQVEQEIAAAKAAPKPEYCFPPIDLLQRPRCRRRHR